MSIYKNLWHLHQSSHSSQFIGIHSLPIVSAAVYPQFICYLSTVNLQLFTIYPWFIHLFIRCSLSAYLGFTPVYSIIRSYFCSYAVYPVYSQFIQFINSYSTVYSDSSNYSLYSVYSQFTQLLTFFFLTVYSPPILIFVHFFLTKYVSGHMESSRKTKKTTTFFGMPVKSRATPIGIKIYI